MLSDHTIGDLYGFATTIATVSITQYFAYRSAVAKITSNVAATQAVAAAEVKTAVCVQEKKIAANFADVKDALQENTDITSSVATIAKDTNEKVSQ